MHGKIEEREGQLPLLILPSVNKLTVDVYRGQSFYFSWLKCRRQKVLDSSSGQFSSEDAAVGGFFHKLVEIYYLQDWDKYVITCDKPNDPAWIEALRLFAAYRMIFPSTEFTKVVACEQVVNIGARERDVPPRGKAEAYVDWLTKRARTMEKFGVPELGAIIDNVVDIDADNLVTLAKTRMFPTTAQPGRYLLDTKTKKQRDTNMEVWAMHELQFKIYMMIAEETPSIGPVKGLITNFAVRHVKLEDKKSFVTTLVPALSEADRIFVKSSLTKCREMSEYHLLRGEKSPANPALCQMYGGCKHSMVLGGTCDSI
jgi:hypothetical protein